MKSFQVFTLLSVLANIRMIVTILIGESLRFVVDAKTALDRVQTTLIANKSTALSSISNRETLSTLQGYFRRRQYKSGSVRMKSFRSGKPALIGARKLDNTSQHSQTQVFLRGASCYWNQNFDCPTLKNLSLKATSGQLVGITGPVGSGKTSLLMAILGELPITFGHSSCIGKIAYLSQVPWVFSGTLQENILFGKEFDQRKYEMVIEACDLKIDFERFPKGDLTEIGQRGVILSGGQRVRVSLARAIYSDADIYLLDDPLSAVDSKVGKHLFEKCIKELLAGRVRILVTHHLQFLKQTDYILMLENGSIVNESTYAGMKTEIKSGLCVLSDVNYDQRQDSDAKRDALQNNLNEFEEDRCTESFVATGIEDGRVDLKDEKEDRMVGAVKWGLYWKYFRAALSIPSMIGLFVFFVIAQGEWLLSGKNNLED